MGDDTPNPFGVKLKTTNNKFSQEIQTSTDTPPASPATKPVGKPPPKPAAKTTPKPPKATPKPPPKAITTPTPPSRETEKLQLDNETKIPPPSDPDPFKKPAKDSSLNRKEEHKEKEEIDDSFEPVKQVKETPVMTAYHKEHIELLDTEDSSTDDSKLLDDEEIVLHPPKHKSKHKSHHHHHHHHRHHHNNIPQPYNFIPPYNENYRYCYYYHLPPPPPSLMKKFNAEAKARSGYYQSPFNEKYLIPPTLLYVPDMHQQSQQLAHPSFNNRAISRPSNYYM